MPTYKDWLSGTVAPPWLRGPWGSKLVGTIGYALDLATDAAKTAVKARMPLQAPPDAYPYIGAERGLERYKADTDTTYRDRLQDAWNVWEFAGTSSRILAAYSAQGLSSARLYAQREIYAPDPYHNWWSAFWVVLDTGHPWSGRAWGAWSWGDGPAAQGGYTWGSNATRDQVREATAAPRKWKAAEEICPHVIVRLSGRLWDPVNSWGSGTWGGTEVRWSAI